ncbi:hypothetical protein IKQ26_09120 [bacterium]|nr:hypothetical protein [bacterium]
MYINQISPLLGCQPLKTAQIKQPKQQNIKEQRTVEYSLWNGPSVSFEGRKKRQYSSVLAGKYEKPSKFRIARIPNLTCPACGQKIMTRHGYTTFLDKIRKAKEEDYLTILDEYKEYMCPTELEVFDSIKEHADRIVKEGGTPHITEIVKDLRQIKLPELEKIQLDKVEDMRDAIQTLPGAEKRRLNEKFNTLTEIIVGLNKKAPFRRKTLIEWVEKCKISDDYVKTELLDIAYSFPSSSESACAWIVKNSGKDKQGNDRSALELAEKLVSIASTSTDHVLARNIELNHDDITNYMAMHKGCNSEKTDKSFMEWYNESPHERHIFIRNYLKDVKEALDKGKIKDKKYKDYIKDCVLNIYKLSKGNVDYREEFCPETIKDKSED